MKRTHLLLLGLFLFLSACAPLPTTLLERDEGGTWREEADESSGYDIDSGPCETPQGEELRREELADLGKLGEWEERCLLPEEDGNNGGRPSGFPLVRNKQVDFYLSWFQTRKRKFFARALARSGRYLDMIREQLAAAELPTELAYLALIESGFVPTACSHAGAVGLWQFIRETGGSTGPQRPPPMIPGRKAGQGNL